jgi:pimeloyl-ACP methyl ester carboxylesterase
LKILEIKGQEPVAPNGKFAMLKGLKIYYEESGNGMPLILLHSFGETCSQWESFIPELSKHYRVIAVDLPGQGRSDYMDTTNVYLHKRASEYIIGLIDYLKFDSVNIIGASSGSFITLYIATLRPKLVKNIIVIGGQTLNNNSQDINYSRGQCSYCSCNKWLGNVPKYSKSKFVDCTQWWAFATFGSGKPK